MGQARFCTPLTPSRCRTPCSCVRAPGTSTCPAPESTLLGHDQVTPTCYTGETWASRSQLSIPVCILCTYASNTSSQDQPDLTVTVSGCQADRAFEQGSVTDAIVITVPVPSANASAGIIMSSGASEAKICALACLEKCHSNVRAIFSALVPNLSPTPAQALNEEDSRLKTLLIGLFPGDQAMLRTPQMTLLETSCPQTHL